MATGVCCQGNTADACLTCMPASTFPPPPVVSKCKAVPSLEAGRPPDLPCETPGSLPSFTEGKPGHNNSGYMHTTTNCAQCAPLIKRVMGNEIYKGVMHRKLICYCIDICVCAVLIYDQRVRCPTCMSVCWAQSEWDCLQL